MGANGSELQLIRSSLNLIQMTDSVELGFGCGGVDLNHRPLGYEQLTESNGLTRRKE